MSRNCWKSKGNQHILLNNKQLVYRHNKAILGQNERFIEKIKIAILTTLFTEDWSGGPQLPFPTNWGISIKHYLNQVKVLSKRGIYIDVSKNLLEFWKSYLKKETAWGSADPHPPPPSVNKGLIVVELFIRFIISRKINISLTFITKSYFKAPKDVQLNTTPIFIANVPNKRELQQIAINHSSDISIKDFINIYRKCTVEPY